MMNWGRDREIEKPKRRVVFILTYASPFGKIVHGEAFATRLSAQAAQQDIKTRLREAFQAMPGLHVLDSNFEILELEVKR